MYQPASSLYLREWSENSLIQTRLRAYFGSDHAFNRFLLTAERIVQLLSQLIKDQDNYVSRKEQDEAQMFNKLKEFAAHRDSNQTKSSFFERFKFFRKQEDREKCIAKLERWNKRLYRLIRDAESRAHFAEDPTELQSQPQQLTNRSISKTIDDSSAHLRALARGLYPALSNYWNCACSSRHQAKFCLKMDGIWAKQVASDTSIDFDFLMSVPGADNISDCWQEGTISVISQRHCQYDEANRLTRVCDAVRLCVRDFQRIRLVMEESNGQQNLWRLEPKPRRMHFLETESPASLHDLLLDSSKMGPREKRELALTCAYSLLLLHDSPWFSRGWGKGELFFFYKPDSEPDFKRPFLSTLFELPAREIGQAGSKAFHPNSNILALGILMIEIFTERPIEGWRTAKERAVVTADTEANMDIKVADRVMRKMDESPHREAIKACLDVDWVPEGQKVLLEDEETRNGLFAKVIIPIESELRMIVN